jgi:3-hydroxyacyl-CoA dehydrogenase
MGASGVKAIGVVGMGLMGSGIAQVSASYGFETIAIDRPTATTRGSHRRRPSAVPLHGRAAP